MHRVAISRRHLAGLLRRSPILDSVVSVASGPGPQAMDEFQVMIEKVDTGPPDVGPPDETRDPRDDVDVLGYPRGSNRM